jgi:hypothetical protein
MQAQLRDAVAPRVIQAPAVEVPPVETMRLDQIKAELRVISGTALRSEDDRLRRQALWRRLDHLIAVSPESGEGAS